VFETDGIGQTPSSCFEIILKLFQPLKEPWNYFKIIPATLNMLKNIHELQLASEIILK